MFNTILFGIILSDDRVFYSLSELKLDSRGGIFAPDISHAWLMREFNIVECQNIIN